MQTSRSSVPCLDTSGFRKEMVRWGEMCNSIVMYKRSPKAARYPGQLGVRCGRQRKQAGPSTATVPKMRRPSSEARIGGRGVALPGTLRVLRCPSTKHVPSRATSIQQSSYRPFRSSLQTIQRLEKRRRPSGDKPANHGAIVEEETGDQEMCGGVCASAIST